MQVQNIQNTQNFNGKLVVVNPHDLSAVPTKLVRKSEQVLKDIISDKPYDLFIRQNHKDKTVSIIAQNPKDFMRSKSLKGEILIDQNADLYDVAALYAVEDYEKALANVKPTIGQKFVNYIKNIFKK